MKILIISTILLFIISGVSAQEENNEFEEPIQEFFTGEPVYTQTKGEFQISPNTDYFSTDLRNATNLGLSLEIGITNKLQFGVGLNYEFISNKIIDVSYNGFQNTEIGLAYNIINTKKWSVTTMIEAELPTADKAVFDDEGFGFTPVIVAAKQLGSTQIHLSTFSDIGDEIGFGYHLGYIVPFGKIAGVVELYGYFLEDIIGDKFIHSLQTTPGFFVIPGEMFQAGIAFPISISEKGSWGAIFSCSFEFDLGE